MSQQYSLRWNNHQPNFISMFTSLLNTQTLVDVTLAAEGKQLKAHKVVLSACSTYFQSLFVDNPSRHPIVILKDVTFADLRTMVDFMYCGEVNVTEEQLPKVLDTAKLLKIKGLTEMPESTSLTRSQGTSSDFQSCTSADFQSPRESLESQRHSVSPALSSSNRRKRRRMSSGGSGQLNLMPEENRGDENAGQVEIMRGANDTVTMRSVPQQRDLDTQHQTNDQQNLNVEPLAMDAANNSVISQESTSAPTIRVRRTKLFKRQSRVQPEEREVHKQASEPAPAHAHSAPQLQKHQSYPQYTFGNRRARTQEIEVDPLAIPDMTVVRQASTSSADQLQRASHTPAMREEVEPLAILDMTVVRQAYSSADQLQRACHTPAMCEGPPLSCNFCWNTVDESGRILRRKTQYHCPECRTNLCIVPCFHEYHDGTAAEASAR